ncbi:MAG TPA: NifU family protein [Lacunisphaera sp.]|jgi:Fe-S cluster biogenesis protein NfuA|nr:NifU family protein [Lacunisphaera sp.]
MPGHASGARRLNPPAPPAVPAPAFRPAPPSPAPGARSRRIQDLLAQVNHIGDPRTRSFVQEVVQALLQLHGVGLARIFEVIEETGNSAVNQQLLDDSVVRRVLLLHDLHPRSLGERLQQALDQVLPSVRNHGGNLELASLRDGVARLRLHGTCQGCAAAAITLDRALRSAIEEFCPDLIRFEFEGARTAPATSPYRDCQAPARTAAG